MYILFLNYMYYCINGTLTINKYVNNTRITMCDISKLFYYKKGGDFFKNIQKNKDIEKKERQI